MPLNIDNIRRGTRVAIAFDDDGKALPVQRHGIITRVETVKKFGKNAHGKTVAEEVENNGNPRNGVSRIFVTLKQGEPEVEVKNAWLAMTRSVKREDWLKLKQEDDARRAALVDAGEVKPEEGEAVLVVNETGSKSSAPVTNAEMRRLTGAPDEELP